MNDPRVLVVDDERQLRRLLQTTLEGHGYAVELASNAKEALELAAAKHPEVVVLDLGLPDMDGLEIVRQLRSYSQVPIIVLSARDDEQAKVQALDLGADDYLTKPFSMNELLARLRVARRHANVVGQGQPVVQFGELEIDFDRRQVRRGDQPVRLTPTEYDLLRLLVNHSDRVLTQRHLLREVWGPGYQDDAQTLRVFINQLRHKIEPEPARPIYIHTEVGVGYRFHYAGESSNLST